MWFEKLHSTEFRKLLRGSPWSGGYLIPRGSAMVSLHVWSYWFMSKCQTCVYPFETCYLILLKPFVFYFSDFRSADIIHFDGDSTMLLSSSIWSFKWGWLCNMGFQRYQKISSTYYILMIFKSNVLNHHILYIVEGPYMKKHFKSFSGSKHR